MRFNHRFRYAHGSITGIGHINERLLKQWGFGGFASAHASFCAADLIDVR